MADSLDMEHRDPDGYNKHIHVKFDDVLAEPDGVHSADCVWRNSYKCFEGGKNICYLVLTFLCGLPLALLWGCQFAVISFSEIWCMSPCIRAVNILMYSVRKLYAIFLNALLAPLMEALGMFFSRIHVVNSQGEAPRPLGHLSH